jgi:septal ring factor EnvC (AmiA/AmiB activator)
MAELNNSLEKDKKLLLSERDLIKKEYGSLRCEFECLMEECERLHSIEEEATILRDKYIGMEERFKEVSVMVKELETDRNRYKAKWEECGSLQYQVSCLQLSLKKANEEKDVLERQVKELESKIADQESSIKDLKQRSYVDTEENKVSLCIPCHIVMRTVLCSIVILMCL